MFIQKLEKLRHIHVRSIPDHFDVTILIVNYMDMRRCRYREIIASKHLPIWYFAITRMSFGPNADLEKKLLFMVTSKLKCHYPLHMPITAFLADMRLCLMF